MHWTGPLQRDEFVSPSSLSPFVLQRHKKEKKEDTKNPRSSDKMHSNLNSSHMFISLLCNIEIADGSLIDQEIFVHKLQILEALRHCLYKI